MREKKEGILQWGDEKVGGRRERVNVCVGVREREEEDVFFFFLFIKKSNFFQVLLVVCNVLVNVYSSSIM